VYRRGNCPHANCATSAAINNVFNRLPRLRTVYLLTNIPERWNFPQMIDKGISDDAVPPAKLT
jgi:hypothetical protein